MTVGLIKAVLMIGGLSLTMPALAETTTTLVPSSTANGEWVGQPATDFRLQDQEGNWHSLKDYQGKWLVLYFYPLDDSPGCTEEARQFKILYPEFQVYKTEVLGISLNSISSHQSFAHDLGLPFPLLADTEHQMAHDYHVLRGIGFLSYAHRETFLIDPKGTIVYHYKSVDTQSHAEQVLKDIEQLQAVK